MAKLNVVLKVAILFSVSLNISCVKVPIDVTVPQVIEISEKEVNDIAEKIFGFLSTGIDFGTPTGTITADECRTAFNVWLREQFDEGLVPSGSITPLTYGKSHPNPNKFGCRTINLDTEYQEATEKYAKDAVRVGGLRAEFGDFQDALSDNKCTGNFLDPTQKKIYLTGMSVDVIENTLSIPTAPNRLFTSFDVTIEELEQPDSEKTLEEDGIIMRLGTLKGIPSRFVGEIPFDLVSNVRKPSLPLVIGEGQLVIIPDVIASEPQTRMVADKRYFVVPKGKIRLRLTIKLDVYAGLSDAKCVLDAFKESIREGERVP